MRYNNLNMFWRNLDMCTAISYNTRDHYFGRNLDYDISFGESITITPRIFPFPFNRVSDMKSHFAIIGMATVSKNYPLYFDAMNEKGLAVAGLLFSENAVYRSYAKDMKNIAPFEFIPWVLGQCSTVLETKELLLHTNILDLSFSDEYPNTPMHWLISDKISSITVEPRADGLKIYDNPIGVLTNNPTFDIQLHNLSNYRTLTPKTPDNQFLKELNLKTYSRGLGALGLPGDFSSSSRFIKATFVKQNSVSNETESESVSQFFHILASVAQIRGCVLTENDSFELTRYSSCCNTNKGIYYYTTYDNNRINGVNMRRENLNSDRLISYSLITEQEINIQN